jgi:hypothetical protein
MAWFMVWAHMVSVIKGSITVMPGPRGALVERFVRWPVRSGQRDRRAMGLISRHQPGTCRGQDPEEIERLRNDVGIPAVSLREYDFTE